jgi:hypothetical protein
MVFYVITFVALIIIAFAIAITAYVVSSKNVPSKNKISFREAMDLAELPVITFYQGKKKFNFMLDSGSNLSHINSKIADEIDGVKQKSSIEVMGLGAKTSHTAILSTFTHNGMVFDVTLQVTDFTDTFAQIKKETGVNIHGILGNEFFRNYKYILDFAELVAYSKKK